MKYFAVDVPCFVTIRLYARDEKNARELIESNVIIDLGDMGFDLGKGCELSPGMTLYPDGFKEGHKAGMYIGETEDDGRTVCTDENEED